MEKIKKIIFIIISLLIWFLISELLLRFYFWYISQKYDIEMRKYAIELKQNINDKRSHIHIPNSHAEIMWADVKINSKWLRDDDINYKKTKWEYRILLLWDSLTFWFWVERWKLFADLLEKKLNKENNILLKNYNKITIINWWVWNYNTEQEFEFLKKEWIKYNPDEILLMYYINDLEKTQKYTDNFFTRDIISFAVIKSLTRNIEYLINSRTYIDYYKNLYNKKKLNKFKKIIKDLDIFTSQKNIKLKVIILPELHNLKDYKFTNEELKIWNIIKKLKIPFLNTKTWFNKRKKLSYYWVAKDDTHPNKYAHKIITNIIFNIFYNEKRQ